jgi:hypothetical protein
LSFLLCLCLLLNKNGSEGGERREWGGKGINDPTNVCTCEYMNNNLKNLDPIINSATDGFL